MPELSAPIPDVDALAAFAASESATTVEVADDEEPPTAPVVGADAKSSATLPPHEEVLSSASLSLGN